MRIAVNVALAAGLAIGVVLSPQPAAATSVVAMDLASLGREATVVVAGRVTGLVSAWDSGRIRTEVTLAPEIVFKGTPADQKRVKFNVLGGEVKGLGQWVPGEARFEVGERVLVFLAPVGPRLTVLGLAQGKWAYSPDVRGAEVAPVDLGGLELSAPGGGVVAPAARGAVSLDAIRAAVAPVAPVAPSVEGPR